MRDDTLIFTGEQRWTEWAESMALQLQTQEQLVLGLGLAAVLAASVIFLYNEYLAKSAPKSASAPAPTSASTWPISTQDKAMINAADFNTIAAKTGQVHEIQNLFQDFYTACAILKMARYSRVFTSKHLEKLQMSSDLGEFYDELDRGRCKFISQMLFHKQKL